ncbi:C-Jun-amino-terminal kinase-interacting protein 4-like isoform X1 [Entelurus aequoreus]|uniref:C-Jun-amino-terminal kinase-interacting protein 4-like isoform X1 n=1 Tax=Entelurus aequoreus TaxID=161455 RepID=UPI002B1E3192|nr:C-Jun-amino-terminal kinase-interacting protein 4-like isoform X1 [Entelurus aequoreus]
MELDDVVLYQDDTGGSTMMSERVSGLANSIYREFERLIGRYDEDVVKQLMPLVVAVLENLDSVFAVNQEHEVEIELLKEDNEQLVTQYEREKSFRKHIEERYIAVEDSLDGERKDLQDRVVTLESHSRQLELKMKNYADQISRFEEREAELKKEYSALHHRHTEMIHSYMEHLERTKHQHAVTIEPADSSTGTPARIRKERPISIGIFHVPGIDGLTSDLQSQPVDVNSEQWRFNNLSHPRSNTSLKDELANTSHEGSKSNTSTNQPSVSRQEGATSNANAPKPSQTGSLKSNTATPTHCCDFQTSRPLSPNGTAGDASSISSQVSATPLSFAASNVAMESVGTPQEQERLAGQTQNLDCNSGKPDNNGKDNLEKSSEVFAIIESTPELDMNLDGCKATSTPTKGGVENLAFDRNTDSLFEELSSAGNEFIGDVDEGADLLGMGREVEHLIQENAQLLETKNALNVVKNDLIAHMDELTCEKDVLQGELDAIRQAKIKLEEKNKDLEDELKGVRAALEDSKQKAKTDDDDSDVPTAQRKRFTRVEMARVLMERNQYKERLMELQEAVRWTEMIRASKETPALTEKKKSSIWQFFSRLFSSSGGASKKPAAEASVNVKYNAPTSQIQPSVKKRSTTLQQLPSDKSKAFDFLNEELAVESIMSRREQKRAQYQQVKAHVQKGDDRVQAYGWSLPNKYKTNGGQEKMNDLPVPVFLRPLDEQDASMKLWCAAGVNLCGGKTRDGGSIVGASVFYSDVAGQESSKKKTGSQNSLDKLDQELEEQQEELRHQDELSSLVWICTSTQSNTKAVVIDANQPGSILDIFFVCNAHILCIASVPGARETDYPAGEEVTLSSESAPADKASLSDSGSSTAGSDGVLGGITVVGCTAEGATAVPQTAGSASQENGETESRQAEAAEDSGECAGEKENLKGVHTEQVFTDPLGFHQASGTPANYSQSRCDLVKDGVSSNTKAEEQDLMREEAQKMSSVLPTMWLGAQNGCVYVHSSVEQWKKCLHSVKLKDSVLGIVHVKGRTLVGLSDGTLAIFHRGIDGQWDLTNYHLLDLGRPHSSIRCMTVVHDNVWCGFRNKIFVVQPKAMKIEKSFDAHPRKESQVRQLAWDGDGIWVSIRLDSTLRLFHARTFQHLQDVDIEPYVSKMLGTGKLGFSFVRITALMVSCNRLWIGTGNGVIISIPLAETANKLTKGSGSDVRIYGDESSDKVAAGTFVPYCSMAHAQLCFHGHRDAVKFFTAVPGHAIPSASSCGEASGGKTSDATAQEGTKSVLVMSGGEGYIDFRMGDEEGDAAEGEDPPMKLQSPLAIAERSHLIVWQVLDSEN